MVNNEKANEDMAHRQKEEIDPRKEGQIRKVPQARIFEKTYQRLIRR